MEFKEIAFGSSDYDRLLLLRDEVLRKPIGMSLYDENLEAERNQAHFGLFDEEDELIGCMIAVEISDKLVKLRQMAIADSFQYKGFGALILKEVEAKLANKGYNEIELHARASALDFYSKQGYTIVGESFVEVGLVHFKMVKTLEK